MWALALAFTYLVMLILLPLAKVKWLTWIFDHIPTWVGMIMLVLGVGLFLRRPNVIFVLEVTLGLVTALYYSRLTTLFKQKTVPA